MVDHTIKCLVSIKTSANPSLNFPTLLDAPIHPTPTHHTKPLFILRYSTLLNLFHCTSILSYLQIFTKNKTKKKKLPNSRTQYRYLSPIAKLEYSTRQTLHHNRKPSPTLSYPTAPYSLLPYPYAPCHALSHPTLTFTLTLILPSSVITE